MTSYFRQYDVVVRVFWVEPQPKKNSGERVRGKVEDEKQHVTESRHFPFSRHLQSIPDSEMSLFVFDWLRP